MELATATGHDSDVNQITAEQIGGVFAFARREKNLTIAFVATELRIPKGYIQAIESSDYSELPGVAYIPGYIRSYAKLLDIDPAPLVAAYLASLRDDDVKPKYVFPEQVLTPKMAGSAIAMVGVVVALVGYVGWFLFERPVSDVQAPQEIASTTNNAFDPGLPDGLAQDVLDETLPTPVADAPLPEFEIADDTQAGPLARPDNLEQLSLPEGTNKTVLASVREAAETNVLSSGTEQASLGNEIEAPAAPSSDVRSDDADAAETENQDGQATEATDNAETETQIASASTDATSTLANLTSTSQGPASANATVGDPNSEILIKAVSASWVEIVRDNGEIVVSKLLRSGDVLAATIEDDLFLSTGNAGGLTLETAAMDAFRVGKVGEILRDFPLTTDMLRDRQVQSEN